MTKTVIYVFQYLLFIPTQKLSLEVFGLRIDKTRYYGLLGRRNTQIAFKKADCWGTVRFLYLRYGLFRNWINQLAPNDVISQLCYAFNSSGRSNL